MEHVTKILLLLLVCGRSLGDECHNLGFECSGPSLVRQCVDGVLQGPEKDCKHGFICDASEEFGPCVRAPSQICCQEGIFPVKDNCRGFMVCIHNGLHLFQYNGACAYNYQFSPYELKCLPTELARCSETSTPLPADTETTTKLMVTDNNEENSPVTSSPLISTMVPMNSTLGPILNETGPMLTTHESSHSTVTDSMNTTFDQIVTTLGPILTTLQPVSTTQRPITTAQTPITTAQTPITTAQTTTKTTQPQTTTTQRPIITTQRPFTTTTIKMTTTTKLSVTTAKCTSPGHISDPSSCRHYIVCSWASQTTFRATKTACTPGLFFDTKLMQCVFNTNCGTRPR